MAEHGCQGYCCAAFHLPYTLTQLRRGVNPERPESRLREGEQIAAMVVPLTKPEADARLEAAGTSHRLGADRGHLFTCGYWDEETRLCTVYEHRPDMCRGFPYGRPCKYGCDEVGTPMEELVAAVGG